MSIFKPAVKQKARLRMAIDGPSGSGKTYTALRFSHALGGRIAVINTESGAVEKYLGLEPDGVPWQFDVGELGDFSPTKYTSAIKSAGRDGYDVLIIDSLTHAWSGTGGALDIKDRSGSNSFTDGWKTVTPMHNQMIDAILQSPCHVIATMRSKTEYVLEEGTNKQGKKVQIPRKIGMAPIQRAGMEYEFDIYASMDWTHTMTVSKSRCPDDSVVDAIVNKPDASWIEPVLLWLNEGSRKTTTIEIPADADVSENPYEVRDNDRAAQYQREQIQELAGELGMDAAIAVDLLRLRYEVGSTSLLTFAQADDLIIHLKDKIEERKIDNTFGTNGAKATV
jgi:hypothetical protein